MATTQLRHNWILPALLCTPAILFLLGFFAAPLAAMARLSLNAGGGASGFGIGGGGFYKPNTWTLTAYQNLAGSAYFQDVLWFTLWFGCTVALICVAIAYPLALAIARLPLRLRLWALAVVTLPKLANVLVVIYGLKLMLSNVGPVNAILLGLGLVDTPIDLLHNLTGTFIGKVYLILPYTVLLLAVALARIDPELNLAARGLGASAFNRFLRVTLPLSLPGLGLAFFVSLVFGLGAFVSPYLMGSPEQITVSVSVQRQTFENLNWPSGAAEAMVMVTALMLLVSLGTACRHFFRRKL